MSEIQNVEALEAEIIEIKEEQNRCKARTLKNLDKLYRILNGNNENSEEEEEQEAAALVESVPQV